MGKRKDSTDTDETKNAEDGDVGDSSTTNDNESEQSADLERRSSDTTTPSEDKSEVEEPTSPAKFSKRPRNKPLREKSDLGCSIRRLVKKRRTPSETQEKSFSDFSSVLKSVQDTLQGIMDIKQKQKARVKEEKEKDTDKKKKKNSKDKIPKTPEL